MTRDAVPDFSGEWILDRPAFTSAGGPLAYEYEMRSDGREAVATQPGVTTVSGLRWEGDALVATWRIQRPAGEMFERR